MLPCWGWFLLGMAIPIGIVLWKVWPPWDNERDWGP